MTPDELEERKLLVIDNLDVIQAAIACPDCASTATVQVGNDGVVTATIAHSMDTCPSGLDPARFRRFHSLEQAGGSGDGTQA